MGKVGDIGSLLGGIGAIATVVLVIYFNNASINAPVPQQPSSPGEGAGITTRNQTITDGEGGTITTVDQTKKDTTPPVIEEVINGTKRSNGWYTAMFVLAGMFMMKNMK
jgi:hypothetical protein